jgi:AcrR family transcriptional regulator
MARTLSPAVRSALDRATDDVVYERGLHEGSIDEICRRAEVGKPAVYRHHGSREALVVDYLERRRLRRNASLLEAMDAAPTQDGPARVRALVDWFARWIESPEFRGCGFQRALQQRPDGFDQIVEITRVQKAWLLGLLTAEAGRPVARHLFLLIEGAMVAGAYERPDDVASDLRTLAAHLLESRT